MKTWAYKLKQVFFSCIYEIYFNKKCLIFCGFGRILNTFYIFHKFLIFYIIYKYILINNYTSVYNIIMVSDSIAFFQNYTFVYL